MSILSKIKTAGKAAKEDKKADAHLTETKPNLVPYKDVQAHAAKEALAAMPTTTVSAEEIRIRIDAARKMKSNTSLRTAQPAEEINQRSRANSESIGPRHTIRRSYSNMSLNEVVMKQADNAQKVSPIPQSRSRRLRSPHDECSFHPTIPSFVGPREVPSIPPRPKSHRSIRSMASMPRIKSPLSKVTVEEESDEYFSSSSRDSDYSTRSSQSTSTSNSEVQQRIASTHRIAKLPKLRIPRVVNAKPDSGNATPLPYSSEYDLTNTKKKKPTVPTWRYEDYCTESQARPGTPSSRKTSLSSIFRKKGSFPS